MKNIIKKISATLAILAILGMSTASAGVSSRDGQLMFNGNFEAGYTGFTNAEGIGSSVAKFEPTAQGSLALRATYNSNTAQAWVYTTQATITATDTAGYSYRIRGMARGDGTLAPRLTRTNSSGGICASLWEGTASTDTQYFDVVFSTSSCSNRIGFDSATNSAGWVEFDNVSITRYYGTVQNRDTQLAVNGGFENGATGWASTGASASEVAPPEGVDGAKAIRVTQTSYPAGGYLYQNILPINTTYTFRAMARGDGVSTTRVLLGATVNCVSAVLTTDWRPVSCTMTSPGTNTNLYIGVLNSTSNGWAEFDNVSITRYYGTVNNRDTNIATDGNMESASTTAWTVFNNGNLTKEAGALNTTGSSVLRNSNSVSSSGAFRLTTGSSVSAGQTYRIRGQVKCSGADISPTINRITGAT